MTEIKDYARTENKSEQEVDRVFESSEPEFEFYVLKLVKGKAERTIKKASYYIMIGWRPDY